MRQRGFTLIEFIMVMVLMSIISVVISKILLSSYQAFITANRIAQIELQNLTVMERVVNDIHALQLPTMLTTMSNSQMVLTKQDGTTANYTLSGTTVLYNGNTLATDVSQFSFAYYTIGGATTTSAANVSYIGITITSTSGNLSSSLSTLAAIRVYNT